MFTKNAVVAFIAIIFHLQIIYGESEVELPKIDYSYISSEDSEQNIGDLHSIMLALNTINNKMQDMAIRQTSMLQTIANLSNVVQTISQNLLKLENFTLELQTQNANHTAQQNNSKGNETNCVRCESECGSESRLLHVSVPSEVHARDDVWKNYGTPAMDDLDVYMVNVTGCRYMARKYTPDWHSSSVGGRWRQTLAVRGEYYVAIRVTWDTTRDYHFDIGYNRNTQTGVYDASRHTFVLERATPGVISRERYTQFYYIQLEEGVLSFGAVGESEPWWWDHVTVADTDVVLMEYWTWSHYGVKLLVCS